MNRGWEIGLMAVGGAVAGIELGYLVVLLMGSAESSPAASPSSIGHASAASSSGITLPTYSYTVQSGDTLSGIASCAGTTVSVIASLNHLSNINSLNIGQTLQLPNPMLPNCSASTGISTPSGTIQPVLQVVQAFVGGGS